MYGLRTGLSQHYMSLVVVIASLIPFMNLFRDAKISVIEWDDANDGIRTSSLHCFENDPALRGGHEVTTLMDSVIPYSSEQYFILTEGRACHLLSLFNAHLNL